MKLVVQRVNRGLVKVNNKIIGQINKGFVVLVGFRVGDNETNVGNMAQKLLNLRVMPDENYKMNLSIKEARGEILLISQFTLYADTSGRRPGFIKAAKPDEARILFTKFVDSARQSGLKVATGQFGTKMLVEIHNDGPVTIILEN